MILTKNKCGRDCKKCSMDKKICLGCSMCDVGFCKCGSENKKRCMVICPKKFGSFALVKNIENKEKLLDNNDIELPGYIPIMPDRTRTTFDFSKVNNTIAIHGEFLLTSAGDEVSPIYRMRGFKRTLNIYGVNGIVEFYVKDRALEGFWSNRYFIYEQLKNMNFLGIITPNFSLYEDAPRIEHLYNIQRVKIMYNEMIRAGLPAILDVVWATVEDLEYWIKEINQSNIKVIAFSFMNVDTRLKASNAWRHYLLGYKFLISRISPNIKIIVAGISSTKRIEEIEAIRKNREISFMHQASWINSRKGFLSEMKKQVSKLEMSKDEIFQRNLYYYSDFINEIRNRQFSDLKNKNY